MMKVGEHEIPDELFQRYVKFKIYADSYMLGMKETPSGSDYERKTRWRMCVEQCMKVHKEICEAIGIPYSMEDEFYGMLHKAVQEECEK